MTDTKWKLIVAGYSHVDDASQALDMLTAAYDALNRLLET